MSSQLAYVPLVQVTLNGTVSVTASASPGNTIIEATVPANTANAINVEITDVDFYNPSQATAENAVYIQMFVSGFGLSSPIYQNIGHTSGAGLVQVPTGFVLGNIRWFLPNGAAGVNLNVGGTVGLAAYLTDSSPGPVVIGASYMIVWGVYSSVV